MPHEEEPPPLQRFARLFVAMLALFMLFAVFIMTIFSLVQLLELGSQGRMHHDALLARIAALKAQEEAAVVAPTELEPALFAIAELLQALNANDLLIFNSTERSRQALALLVHLLMQQRAQAP